MIQICTNIRIFAKNFDLFPIWWLDNASLKAQHISSRPFQAVKFKLWLIAFDVIVCLLPPISDSLTTAAYEVHNAGTIAQAHLIFSPV